MITPAYAVTMARYNTWRNEADFAAAESIGETARRLDRGAFFGSIHGTLSHLLWGDRIWLHRFIGTPAPECGIPDSPGYRNDWGALVALRRQTDAEIGDWAAGLTPDALEGDLTWFSGSVNRDVSKPLDLLVVHFFNHQTHHRGQAHAMLTAAGAKPGVSDLPFMPDDGA